MTYLARFNRKENEDAERYEKATKEVKIGLSMVMDGLENNDMGMVANGAARAWDGNMEICELSEKMKRQYGERGYDGRGGNYGNRVGYYERRDGDWNQRDDEFMMRRMRDAMGRFSRS
jgi:hypothetical protein